MIFFALKRTVLIASIAGFAYAQPPGRQAAIVHQPEFPGYINGRPAVSEDGEYLTLTEKFNRKNEAQQIHFPEQEYEPRSLGTVSADVLRHPLSRKGRALLVEAEKAINQSDHTAAIAKLIQAFEESSARPYAHGMLGAQYLVTGKFDAALPHLQASVALMPSFAPNHLNLGYLLCLTGHCESGESEIRTALTLDKNCVQAQYLLGVILLDRGDPEAVPHLQAASQSIRGAHLFLALSAAQRANVETAQQELLAYLGPAGAEKLPVAQAWLKAALSRVSTPHGAQLKSSFAAREPVSAAGIHAEQRP